MLVLAYYVEAAAALAGAEPKGIMLLPFPGTVVKTERVGKRDCVVIAVPNRQLYFEPTSYAAEWIAAVPGEIELCTFDSYEFSPYSRILLSCLIWSCHVTAARANTIAADPGVLHQTMVSAPSGRDVLDAVRHCGELRGGIFTITDDAISFSKAETESVVQTVSDHVLELVTTADSGDNEPSGSFEKSPPHTPGAIAVNNLISEFGGGKCCVVDPGDACTSDGPTSHSRSCRYSQLGAFNNRSGSRSCSHTLDWSWRIYGCCAHTNPKYF